MDWKVIKTATQYKKAVKRTIEIFQAREGTPEADELELLLVLVKDYEDKHIVLPELDPIEAIKLKMEERGLKAKDLEPLIGSKGHVSSILSGRRELTLKTAQKLKDFLRLPADVFMQHPA
jgi:HTH-type transcriptional regulator/antitoxin HigA